MTQIPARTDHFETAAAFLFANEGGLADHPADPGGITNLGVSLRYLKRLGDLDKDGKLDGDLDQDGDVDAEDIRAMTPEAAKTICRRQWWDRYGYVGFDDAGVAAKVLDLSFNMGPKAAHTVLQRALRACGKRVAEDGALGPATFAAANAAAPSALIPALRSEAAGFYRSLAAEDSNFMPFYDGWMNRAYA